MIKQLLVTLIFLLPSYTSLSQNKLHHWHRPTEAEKKLAAYHAQCVHTNKYSAAQRLKFYPFSKAVQVKLVAFETMYVRNVRVRLDDGTQEVVGNEEGQKRWDYPFWDNKIDTSQFIETKLLDKFQINRLTDLLYNFGQRAVNYNIIYSQYACYSPRNAVVFINAKGKIFAYIEICFECKQIRTKPESMKIGDYCEDKLSLLQRYFASANVKFGVDTSYTRHFNNIKPY